MSLGSDIALLHRTLQTYSPHECTLRGAVVPCTPSTESRGTILASGGKELEIQLTLFILQEDLIAALHSQEAITNPGSVTADDALATADSEELTSDDATCPPRSGEILTYKQRQYRIETVRAESDDTVYRLELGSPDR